MATLGTTKPAPPTSIVTADPIVVGAPAASVIPMERPAPQPPRPPQKRSPRNRRILLIGLVALLVLSGVVLIRKLTRSAPTADIQMFVVSRRSFPIILKEKGELKAANSIDIRTEVEGHATIIYVIPEGSRVKEGELLVELASDEIDEKTRDADSKEANANAAYETAVKTRDILLDENASKISKAALALSLAKLVQDKFLQGDKKQYEQDANLLVQKAKVVLTREQQDLKDAKELSDQGFITRVELEDAKFNEYAAGLDLRKAELALEVLNKYTIPMYAEQYSSAVREAQKDFERAGKAAEASEAKATADVEAKKSDFEIARDKLAKLREQKTKTKIVAPAAGLVVYAREGWWRTEPTIETGVQVHERQMLIQLPDTSKMKVEVRVHEAQIERLQVGMPATVLIEGFSNRSFNGKIAKIAVMADSQNMFLNPNLREYKTDVLLDGTFLNELKPNVTAKVEIHMAQLDNVLAVPIQAVFAKAGKFFIFADDGPGSVKPVPVQPGLSSTEFVEIKSGLKEGQQIRLAVTDDMKLMLPEEAEEAEADADHRSKPKLSVENAVRPTSKPAISPERKPDAPAAAPLRPDRAASEAGRPERRPVTSRESR